MIKKCLSMGLLLSFLLMTGCASLPSPEVMKSETANFKVPVLPESNKAMVYVVRPSGVGGLIRFNVFVDDQQPNSEMGYTRSSQYIYFNVTPGQHFIYSKAENWSLITINAKPNEIIFLEQDPSIGIFMARNNLLKIEDYQGKYHLKTLSLGTIIKTEK